MKEKNIIVKFVGFILMTLIPYFFSCNDVERNLGSVEEYNILFIVVDDLRPELGCYGNEHIVSPNIDKLASKGLTFERAYCQQAVCSPSRISVLTGLRPTETGITDNQTHLRETLPNVVTLPEYFKKNGYHSVGIGKVFHGHDHSFEDERAWSEHWLDAPQMLTKNIRGYRSNENIRILRERNKDLEDGKVNYAANIIESEDVADNGYSDGVLAELALSTLERIKDSTFFLAVGFRKPHEPFVAPKKYWDLYDSDKIQLPKPNAHPHGIPELAFTNWEGYRNYADIPKEGPLSDKKAKELIHGYYACISYVDAQIGKVLDKLNDLKLDKNTIVMIWGDHGIKLGEYGDWSKKTNFELDTRSPLIIYHPEISLNNKKTKSLVELVDLYPTLAEMTGVGVPEQLQGTSLAPLFKNSDTLIKHEAVSQYPRKIVDEAGESTMEIMGYSIRTDKYRYTKWINVENPDEIIARELYDHSSKKLETENLIDKQDYQEQLLDLDRRLSNFIVKKAALPKSTVTSKQPL